MRRALSGSPKSLTVAAAEFAAHSSGPQRLSQLFWTRFCIFRSFVDSRYTSRNPTN